MSCFRTVVCGVAVAGLATVGLTVASSPPSASSNTKTTVTWAELPEDSPNFIFPYLPGAYFTTANLDYFQYYMFRPLYWFGGPSSVTMNKRFSLAATPVFSNGDRTAKITLKPYKWSNGTQVDATDVVFWMNIWKAEPTGYAGWFPGGLSMPTSVKSVKVTNARTLTITFDRAFNPHWLLYNEFSQITPLPLAWTKTSRRATAGSAGCAKARYGTDDAACKAVYEYLSEQSGFDPAHPSTTINALPTYASNPLWKVVDGPWELTSFAPTADVVFKINPVYSGPNKPRIKKFVEKPFTTAQAEFNALVTGTVDIGYLPSTDVTAPAANSGRPGVAVSPGMNNPRLSTFTLVPSYAWQIRYYWYNYRSTADSGEAGKIFSQLYIRQAMQRLVDQTLYVAKIYKGYAYADYGPVPTLPRNPFSSTTELKNPYPYSVSTAKRLLASHGWKVVPGGTSVCEKPGGGPGDCGPGIRMGALLDFTLKYISGTKALADMMTAEKSSWSAVGINVTLSSATTSTVVGDEAPCPKGCSWEINGPNDWTFLPDIYPSGEEIFASGAGANNGLFSTARNNELIKV
ncbi:MAG: ABC transporter substrate-binding protein, partial [Nitrososphaerales archaeon]